MNSTDNNNKCLTANKMVESIFHIDNKDVQRLKAIHKYMTDYVNNDGKSNNISMSVETPSSRPNDYNNNNNNNNNNNKKLNISNDYHNKCIIPVYEQLQILHAKSPDEFSRQMIIKIKEITGGKTKKKINDFSQTIFSQCFESSYISEQYYQNIQKLCKNNFNIINHDSSYIILPPLLLRSCESFIAKLNSIIIVADDSGPLILVIENTNDLEIDTLLFLYRQYTDYPVNSMELNQILSEINIETL